MTARSFAIGADDFLLDGEPFRVLSGALHYFRVHPDHWADRIRKARLMGLNTIETYVAWNAHEPRRGEWDASGQNDLGRFLDLIAAEGMLAIVRPGPYICAEWHNGGLPVWLTSTHGIGLRRAEAQYLAAVTDYLEEVYAIVKNRQVDAGGPVILVQIENEYGAYGRDKEYLAELVRVTRAAGITVPLTTIDQPVPQMLRDGSLTGLHLTGSFGSRATERLATLREHQPTGPLMCAEFWDGWFDWWGAKHHTTSADESAAELDALLAAGASVNFYMFHGGTNFGLTNGANDKGRYAPIVTSYDYDAPLDEAGNPTEKYFAFREVLSRYSGIARESPSPAASAPEVEVSLRAVGNWVAGHVPAAHSYEAPPTFDELEHDSALVIFEADLPEAPVDVRGADSPFGPARVFEVDEVRDRAWVAVDGRPVGTLARELHERAIAVPAGRRLSVLVEDQGRVNYATRLGEPKGLIGRPLLDGRPLTGWSVTPIDVAAVGRALGEASESPTDASTSDRHGGPVALRASFALDAPVDLFLDTDGWGKGYAFVNGFFLGRYWRSGPQRTLFVPAPVVRAGDNTVVVLELEQITRGTARFVPSLLLGHVDE